MLSTSDFLLHVLKRNQEKVHGEHTLSHMLLLQVSPPLAQFLPGANDRPNFPLMQQASAGVATQEIVKPRAFATPPFADIMKPNRRRFRSGRKACQSSNSNSKLS